MKKILMLVLAIGCIGFASENTVEVRVGLDLTSKTKLESDDFDDTSITLLKKGFELGTEYRRKLGDSGFEIGGGLFYKHNSYKELIDDVALVDGLGVDTTTKKFNSLPLYVTGRYNFDLNSEVVPYVKANLGYSINSGKYERVYNENDPTGYYDIKGRLDERLEFKNGLYYGLGAGLKYRNFSVDLSYNEIHSKFTDYYMNHAGYTYSGSSSTTEYDYTTDKGKVKNKFVTLSFGYNFQF